MNRRESRFSHRQAHVQVLSSSLEDSSCYRRSRSPESIGINTSISPDAEVVVFEQQNSLLDDTNSGPIAASSSIDEQVLKGKFCTDTDSQGEISTLSGCPFECDDEQRSLSELKSHIQLHHAEKNPAGETPQSSSNTTSANLLCPFECTDKPFETKNDRKEHLIKVHSCTPTSENSSTKDENRKGTRLGKDMNVIDERIAQEKNEIRKTNILADTLSRLVDIDPDARLDPENAGWEFGYYVFEMLPKLSSEEIASACEILSGTNIILPDPDLQEPFTQILTSPLTNDQLQALQAQDEKCTSLIAMLRHGKLDPLVYSLSDGVLNRRVIEGGQTFQAIYVPRTPPGLIESILKAAHDDSGHNGFPRTYSAIRRLYYWKGIKEDV